MGTRWTWEAPICERGEKRKMQLLNEIKNGMRTGLQCRAKSRQTGKQCGASAIPWGTNCKWHGGASPQSLRVSEERRRAAYVRWNETDESERHLHFPAWPVSEVDFTRPPVRKKQKSATATAKALDEKKARMIAEWPEPEPREKTWPPSTTAIWNQVRGKADKPAAARIERNY